MGWNTWCTLGKCGRDYCNETEIRSIAQTMIRNGMKDLGYNYVNLDDCWADRRDANGNILADASRFPSGMKALADYIHSLGMKFGLYTCAGTYTCSSGGRDHKIPGSYGHYDQDAKTYASWGIDYVKMDWCNTEGLDPKIQYPLMTKAINASGRAMFFEMCEWGKEDPWEWAQPYANAWRATGDHHDEWGSTSNIIDQMAGLGKYAESGAWNYMDFLMTGGQGCDNITTAHCPGMTNTEYITEFTMWTICNSGLIVATDIRTLTPIMKKILFNKEVIAINQDALKKAGDRVSASDCGEDSNTCQVWAKELYGGSYAIVLYNKGSSSHDITADFTKWGWSASDSAKVRDLWKLQDMGTFTGSFKATVPSHGVVLVRMTKA